MKRMLIAALALGFVHSAHAGEKTAAEKAKLAADLPKTVVVRIKKNDPSKVEVMHLNKALSPNKDAIKTAGGKFQELAVNSQMTGKAVGGANELDASSSTSSWSFGYYGVPRYYGYAYSPYRSYGYGGYGGYGSGCGYSYSSCYHPSYYYNSCGYSSCYSPSWYTPSYYYGGYSYAYQPYYGYSDNSYYYAYCNYSAQPYYNSGYYNNWWY